MATSVEMQPDGDSVSWENNKGNQTRLGNEFLKYISRTDSSFRDVAVANVHEEQWQKARARRRQVRLGWLDLPELAALQAFDSA